MNLHTENGGDNECLKCYSYSCNGKYKHYKGTGITQQKGCVAFPATKVI